MTATEWILLEVGDYIVERKSGVARPVLSVSRVSGKPGQCGKTRTMVTIPSIKSPGRTTVICNAADLGGERFDLRRAKCP